MNDHTAHVIDRVKRFAKTLHLSDPIAEDLELAAFLHDAGKADPRFQLLLYGADPWNTPGDGHAMAKSGRRSPRDAWERAGLPRGWRHEALSVRMARAHPRFAEARNPALVLWLIGTHHGFGRPFFEFADPRGSAEEQNWSGSCLGVATWRVPPGPGPESPVFDVDGADWATLYEELKGRYGIWTPGAPGDDLALGGPPRLGMRTGAAVMTRPSTLRLDGLEPDNLLAFLALLGLLRALERVRPQWRPRVAWTVDAPPVRPVLHVNDQLTPEMVLDAAVVGLDALAALHDFDGLKDLKLAPDIAAQRLRTAAAGDRYAADLWAALLSDAAVRTRGSALETEPTPLCLLSTGRTNFLSNLASVPRESSPPASRRTKVSAAECLGTALFQPWTRPDDATGRSFRWDPHEAVRHALRATDPTDAKTKQRTQHGANRLGRRRAFGTDGRSTVLANRKR